MARSGGVVGACHPPQRAGSSPRARRTDRPIRPACGSRSQSPHMLHPRPITSWRLVLTDHYSISEIRFCCIQISEAELSSEMKLGRQVATTTAGADVGDTASVNGADADAYTDSNVTINTSQGSHRSNPPKHRQHLPNKVW